MNAHAGELCSGEMTRQRRIPRQARGATPAAAHTVSEGAGGKIISGTQVTYPGQSRRVFHFRFGSRSLRRRAKQPRRRDETARRQSRGDKFISRPSDSAKCFVVVEIIKFAFVIGIKPGQEFLARILAVSTRSLMKIAMDHNLVSLRFQILKPADKSAILRG